MKKKEKDNANYLDMIPKRNDAYPFTVEEDGSVILDVENTGLFNLIAQKLFKKPRISHVHLQGQGNFIWTQIDGERTVYDIAQLLKAEYGEEAEPLYPRLVQYIKTLESYSFITISK
ncbi:MAG: PqqD family protein [Lachnospiraceae bacterium]|nr:PqqD family protein [Lachnospiraceae bacterium]